MKSTHFVGIVYESLVTTRESAPYKTGNLRYNATVMRRINAREWEITVQFDIAPYAPYTNEPWISPKWKGRKNPNEGWWENNYEKILNDIITKYGGRIER